MKDRRGTTSGTTGTTTEDATEGRPDPDDPIKPDGPTDMTRSSWGHVLRSTLREFMDDQCTDVAATLTYYAVLAAAPALVAVVSILGLVGDPEKAVDDLLGVVEDAAPAGTVDSVRPIVENIAGSTGAGLALVLGLVGALWSASGYVGAFGRAMNRVYEVEEGRPIWKLRPYTILVTIVVVVIAVIVVASLVMSGPVARAVGDAIGLSSVAVTVWNIAKWPFVVLLVVVVVAVLYWATPNVKQPRFRWVSPGAVVAILAAALASLGLALYVGSGFASFGATYGTLAGLFIALLWMWIINLALLFGAELDAEIERTRELQGGIAAEEQIKLPPRDTSASDKKAAKYAEHLDRARALRESNGETADAEAADPKTTDSGTAEKANS